MSRGNKVLAFTGGDNVDKFIADLSKILRENKALCEKVPVVFAIIAKDTDTPVYTGWYDCSPVDMAEMLAHLQVDLTLRAMNCEADELR